MQEITWAKVQDVTPDENGAIAVHMVGDSEDIPVKLRSADYTPVEGHVVQMARAGSADSWVIQFQIVETG